VSARTDAQKKGGAGDDEKESDVEIDVLVLDHGTGFIKAGFAGQDAPRLVIPTLVASQSAASSAFSSSSSSSSSSADASSSASASASAQEWIGADALHAYRAAHAPDANADDAASFALTCPIERGQITDWDAMQRIWDFIFRQLRVDPARHAVLIALPPPIHQKSAQATRERLAEIFFQQYRVRALCIANACVLSLFASGRTTGLVLELGEGATFAVPVFEGVFGAHRHFILSCMLPVCLISLSVSSIRPFARLISRLCLTARHRVDTTRRRRPLCAPHRTAQRGADAPRAHCRGSRLPRRAAARARVRIRPHRAPGRCARPQGEARARAARGRRAAAAKHAARRRARVGVCGRWRV
jgi:hypothetical protein